MPIKPENRALYPANWKELRATVLERAGHRCELCFLPNGALIWRDAAGAPQLTAPPEGTRQVAVLLTTAHINQDPTDNRMINLRALCQRCHNLVDLPYRQLNAAATRAAKAERRLKASARAQARKKRPKAAAR